MTQENSPIADITLLLEGTYPYVKGGVSSWVHQIIQGLPEFTFSLIFIGGLSEQYDGVQYELPENVVHFESHFIMERVKREEEPMARKGCPAAFSRIEAMHEQFKRNLDSEAGIQQVKSAIALIGKGGEIDENDFLYSESAWRVIETFYEKYCTAPSFVDYFWTIREMHAPLFRLIEIARNAPDTRVLHSISTGYAGLLGAVMHMHRETPYLISEHGIYTKERKIDLYSAKWIKESEDEIDQEEGSYFRRLWIRFFEALGKLAYSQADRIVALYEGNRRRQIKDGAPPEKCIVIPNGIDVERFTPLVKKRPKKTPPVVALIGRVVPIKDIKTFIRAMRVVCNEMPQAEGWIIGPEDEDPQYVEECKALTEALGLSEQVKFLGFQNIQEILPRVGVVMLTSISEAQPLVLLESMAAGVPCVATDVGSCREIVEGADEEDRALGQAGFIVPIAAPQQTAWAAIQLLRDQALWIKAQQVGLQRVRKFYHQKLMYKRYRNLYQEALSKHNGRHRV